MMLVFGALVGAVVALVGWVVVWSLCVAASRVADRLGGLDDRGLGREESGSASPRAGVDASASLVRVASVPRRGPRSSSVFHGVGPGATLHGSGLTASRAVGMVEMPQSPVPAPGDKAAA